MMDYLEKKKKTRIRTLIEEDVHYCEPEHGTIFGEDGVEEGLAESLMNSWESLDQQKNMLIRKSMGDKNFNTFEINELCIYAGITCDKHCEVAPEVKEEEGEYPCFLTWTKDRSLFQD